MARVECLPGPVTFVPFWKVALSTCKYGRGYPSTRRTSRWQAPSQLEIWTQVQRHTPGGDQPLKATCRVWWYLTNLQGAKGRGSASGKGTFGLAFGFPAVPQTRATWSLVLPRSLSGELGQLPAATGLSLKLAPKSRAPPVQTTVIQRPEVVIQKQIPEIKKKTQGEAQGPVRFNLLQRQWSRRLAGRVEACDVKSIGHSTPHAWLRSTVTQKWRVRG